MRTLKPVATLLTLLLASCAFFVHGDIAVQKGLFIVILIGGLWVTEALNLTATALLVPVLAVALGLLDVKKALASFADPIIALFFGGFVLASALRHHGLDRLLAARVILLARGRLLPAALLLFAATGFISMWVSNTATAAMMLPLALGLVAGVDRERDRSTILFVLLGVGWMASLGGMGSLVGSPPNALASAAAGWTFADWFRVGLPAMLILSPLAILTLFLTLRPRIGQMRVAGVDAMPEDATSPVPCKQSNWTFGTITTLTIFAMTVIAWMLSDPLGKVIGIDKDFDALIAVSAVVLLLATGTVGWQQAARDVDWGVLLLFGGGLCLGAVLKASGASDFLAQSVIGEVSGLHKVLLLLALATFIVLLSELASNTAATALLLPLLLPLAPKLGLSNGELAAFVALTASCGFMLPVATPPNAIIFGTGLVTQREMIRTGFWLDGVCIVVLVMLFA
jgi:sodium-dependent dicarboxylate transporter 2/3/5